MYVLREIASFLSTRFFYQLKMSFILFLLRSASVTKNYCTLRRSRCF